MTACPFLASGYKYSLTHQSPFLGIPAIAAIVAPSAQMWFCRANSAPRSFHAKLQPGGKTTKERRVKGGEPVQSMVYRVTGLDASKDQSGAGLGGSQGCQPLKNGGAIR